MATFTVFTDPSHGWMKVSRTALDRLGIADKITPFSFVRGESVFLEEDLDASTFIEAYKAAGKEIKFKVQHTNRYSKIRNYDSYYIA